MCHMEGYDYEDYMREMKALDDTYDGRAFGSNDRLTMSSSEEDLTKSSEENDPEFNWLQDAGYGHLIGSIRDGHEIRREEVLADSSLTAQQTVAVLKRVDTVNATLRQNSKQNLQRTDIRNVFTAHNNVEHQINVSSLVSNSVEPPVPPKTGVVMREKSRKATGRNSREILLHKKSGIYSMDADNTDISDSGIKTLSIHSETVSLNTLNKSLFSSTNINNKDLSEKQRNNDSSRLKPDFSNSVLEEGASTQLNRFSLQNNPDYPILDDNPDMPKYSLKLNSLGVTNIDHLGENDLTRIRKLAFIELSSLCDEYKLSYSRIKRRKKTKENGVFGVPLSILLSKDQKHCSGHKLKVPTFFQQLIHYLETNSLKEEGVLRVPGSVTRIKQLREEIESNFNGDRFFWDDVRPNDGIGLLKQFLKELPNPLLTGDYIHAYSQLQNIPDVKQKIHALNLLFILLPDVNRNVLQMLMNFLLKIVVEKENKMTLNNVAMIMAANLFLGQNERSSPKSPKLINQLSLAANMNFNVVKLMIFYQKILFTVPEFMISQIRIQYESEGRKKSKEKQILKFMKKENSENKKGETSLHLNGAVHEHRIELASPQLGLQPTFFLINSSSKVSDVLLHFDDFVRNYRQQKKSLINVHKYPKEYISEMSLFEVGGNISRRRLSLSTNLFELYLVNPNTQWIIADHIPE